MEHQHLHPQAKPHTHPFISFFLSSYPVPGTEAVLENSSESASLGGAHSLVKVATKFQDLPSQPLSPRPAFRGSRTWKSHTNSRQKGKPNAPPREYQTKLESQESLVQILSLLLICCVTLDKLLWPSGPQFPHLSRICAGPSSSDSLGLQDTQALKPGITAGMPAGTSSTADPCGTLRSRQAELTASQLPALCGSGSACKAQLLEANACFNLRDKMDIQVVSELEPFILGWGQRTRRKLCPSFSTEKWSPARPISAGFEP